MKSTLYNMIKDKQERQVYKNVKTGNCKRTEKRSNAGSAD